MRAQLALERRLDDGLEKRAGMTTARWASNAWGRLHSDISRQRERGSNRRWNTDWMDDLGTWE
jgi:hypothetical protein